MSKTFVVVCIIIILGSFVGACFLMSTVNPPPLKRADHKLTKWKESLKLSMSSNPSATSFRKANDNDIPSNPLESLTPFYRFNHSSLSARINNVTYVDDDEEPLYNFPLHVIKNVVAPIFIPVTTSSTTDAKETTTQLNELKDNTSRSTESTGTDIPSINSNLDALSSPIPEKGFRRSVDHFLNKVIDEISHSVIIKIINEYGQPKIEIKIDADDFTVDKKKRSENGSNLELVIQKNNTTDEKNDLGLFTEIKILPNETVLIKTDDKSIYGQNFPTKYKNELSTSNYFTADDKENKQNDSGIVNTSDKYIDTDNIIMENSTKNKSDAINKSSDNVNHTKANVTSDHDAEGKQPNNFKFKIPILDWTFDSSSDVEQINKTEKYSASQLYSAGNKSISELGAITTDRSSSLGHGINLKKESTSQLDSYKSENMEKSVDFERITHRKSNKVTNNSYAESKLNDSVDFLNELHLD